MAAESAEAELKVTRLIGKKGLAPNMKVILRDRARASRQLISRPWVAEVALT